MWRWLENLQTRNHPKINWGKCVLKTFYQRFDNNNKPKNEEEKKSLQLEWLIWSLRSSWCYHIADHCDKTQLLGRPVTTRFPVGVFPPPKYLSEIPLLFQRNTSSWPHSASVWERKWTVHFIIKIAMHKGKVQPSIGRLYLILFHRTTFLGPGMSRLWNSLNLAATRADTSTSRRSPADSVWKSQTRW